MYLHIAYFYLLRCLYKDAGILYVYKIFFILVMKTGGLKFSIIYSTYGRRKEKTSFLVIFGVLVENLFHII